MTDNASANWKYECFYKDKRTTIVASGLSAAKDQVCDLWKVPKKARNLVSVLPVERADGSSVVHSTGGL